MNTVVTSKEEILKKSRERMQQQGWSAMTIRSVAADCHVSVGSIYNYFGSKEELIGAAIESVWCDIFHPPEEEGAWQDTLSCISWIYRRMEYGAREYPGFFTLHSMGLMGQEKAAGKRQMQQTWQHIVDGLCTVLKQDLNIRPDAFDEQLSLEKFAHTLFSMILAAFLWHDYDATAVLEMVRRSLY